MSPFYLLRLPSLARINVFAYMNLDEQFKLSLTSSKAKSWVKLFLRSNYFHLTLSFDNENYHISIHNQKLENATELTFCELVKSLRFLKKAPIQKFTQFENDVKYLIEFSADVFTQMELLMDFHGKRHIFVIGLLQFVNRLGLKVKVLEIRSEKSENEIIQFIMNNCPDTPHLDINCGNSSDFICQYSKSFKFDFLKIQSGSWVTVSHLTKNFINCRNLALFGCKLDHHILREFFKRWMQGSRLEYVDFYSYNIRFTDIFKGLPATVLPRVKVFGDTRQFTPGRCFLIQQKNGKRAIVYWDPQIILTTDFELL